MNPTWVRFDICSAWFVFAMLWHQGQWSPEYQIFGRLNKIGYKSSPLHHDEHDLTDNAKLIYEQLYLRQAVNELKER